MAVDYVGRDVSPFGYQVKKITAPPQRVYSGKSLTREEREAWLALMPQVRVWRVFERSFAGLGKLFYGGRGTGRLRSHRFCGGGENADLVTRAATPSTALERLHRRARYIVRGEETDITVVEFRFILASALARSSRVQDLHETIYKAGSLFHSVGRMEATDHDHAARAACLAVAGDPDRGASSCRARAHRRQWHARLQSLQRRV